VAHQPVHCCKVKQFRFGPAVTRFDAVDDPWTVVTDPGRRGTVRPVHPREAGS